MPSHEDGAVILAEDDWNWALEEQTRIGRVRIWLWREKAGGARELRDIQVRAIGNEEDEVSVRIGDKSIDIYVGTQLDVSQQTIEIKTNNKIEIGLKTIEPEIGNRVDDKLRKKYDRFGLSNLKQSGIGKLSCGRCKNELVDGLDEANTKWFALPSEDWEEFVEYWVCHEDIKLKSADDDNRTGGNGLRKPSFNEGFIGDWFLEFDLDWIDQLTPSQTMGWIQQSNGDVSDQSAKKQYIECSQCKFTIGEVEESRYENGNDLNPHCSRPKRRWIKFYKRAITSINSKLNDLVDQDDENREFETSLIQDEIFKLIESNGFYKVMIKNSRDMRSIGLWIFCPTVWIRCRIRPTGDVQQKLARSKLMYVLLDGDHSSSDQAKLDRFENGTPIRSIKGSCPRINQGLDRRIGEMSLPRDHFDLLVEKLRAGSIYWLGQSTLKSPTKDFDQIDRQKWLDHLGEEDELFQGIYRTAYL
ncbi:hypothetical protein Pst134EA_005583 [Puccinia striiformis f. sp. tritici]|uniref:hypothetical protein n=1 Tax=Puccinia striiformis f. sp. tritici TaxID=168172 RepID=UPI002008B2E4|nr:hypothetical protein Pst134EA_005583 [Puccinia striiformis f. sp. tritici]KAH9471704.1 hypothetical protein Pst134EA_005583 [Puccinia striiformis f. sp. tritici]